MASEETIRNHAVAIAVAIVSVPIYHTLIKPAAKPQEEKNDGRRRSRRPSVIEELTAAPLVVRVLLWLQCFQGLVTWLAPKQIVDLYGVNDISKLGLQLGEDWGRVWVAIHFGALVGSRPGVSASTVISTGNVLLLLSELKAFLNDEYFGHTPSRVTAVIVIKLLSLWALEYGTDLSFQEGLLAETVSKIIPSEDLVGQFLALFVMSDGVFMYFYPASYASFWGFDATEDDLTLFLTVGCGYSLIMLGVFWMALLKNIEIWKAYGVSAIVYFLATVDLSFIGRDGMTMFQLTEIGPTVDLTLSFISIVSTEAWKTFF